MTELNDPVGADQPLTALSHTALSHNLAIFRDTFSKATSAPKLPLSSQTLGVQEEAACLLHSHWTGHQWS